MSHKVYHFNLQVGDYIELPCSLRKKHSILNIHNADYSSILYCIAAGLKRVTPRKNRTRTSHYTITTIKSTGIHFPTPFDDIPKLEQQNKIMINVYTYNTTSEQYKLEYLSDRTTFSKEINLLAFKKDDYFHYTWIKNIRVLINEKLHGGFFCKRCVKIFISSSLFMEHHQDCINDTKPHEDVIYTPVKLKKRTGLVRMHCNPSESLQWSIVSALNPKYDSSGRFCSRMYPYQKLYDRMEFPEISSKDIPTAIQILIKTLSININVFLYREVNNKDSIVPYIIPKTNHPKNVDLLLFKEDNHDCFMIIKDLSSIYYSRTNNRHFVCRRCLEICLSEEKLKEHSELCQNFKPQKVFLPRDDDKILSFTNHRKQYEIPFIAYSDFEVILEAIENQARITHKHVPIAFSYKLYSYIDGVTQDSKVYIGLDCAQVFIKEMIRLHDMIKPYFEMDEPLSMSEEDEYKFLKSEVCHICGKKFTNNIVKVRDHDHMTGNSIFHLLTHIINKLSFVKYLSLTNYLFNNIPSFNDLIIIIILSLKLL